ncbi:MAG: hypothetical protein IPM63_02400 [Acidobacteriota bacterium]|nr:MAG: hypothetical protein IPM63_02400 [Acidobacteriota bacterium]
MRTSCAEITEKFNTEGCKEEVEYYRLEKFRVRASYSTGPCQLAYGKRWNVPEWTLVSAEVFFRDRVLLNSFAEENDLDLEKCSVSSRSESQILGEEIKWTIHSCVGRGISIWSESGVVSTVLLVPDDSASSKLCESASPSDCV